MESKATAIKQKKRTPRKLLRNALPFHYQAQNSISFFEENFNFSPFNSSSCSSIVYIVYYVCQNGSF